MRSTGLLRGGGAARPGWPGCARDYRDRPPRPDLRHRPESGYTKQLANPAWLAELTDITVVADFRSRDVAAGGQGAPLVRHSTRRYLAPRTHRVVVNIGGIANLALPAPGDGHGFDSGPGNTLLDLWIHATRARPIATVPGVPPAHAGLLAAFKAEPILRCRRRRAPGATGSTWVGGTALGAPASNGARCAGHAHGADRATVADAMAQLWHAAEL